MNLYKSLILEPFIIAQSQATHSLELAHNTTFTRRRTEDVGASVSPSPKDEPRLVFGLGHFLRPRVHLVDRSTQPTPNSFDVPSHICLPSLARSFTRPKLAHVVEHATHDALVRRGLLHHHQRCRRRPRVREYWCKSTLSPPLVGFLNLFQGWQC